MPYLIETYDSNTNTKRVLSFVFYDRTTACVYAQDYIRDNNPDTLYYRVIKGTKVSKKYLEKDNK